MSGRGHPCWECGRPAPAGVCLGPHEGFSLNAAIRSQMVMNLDRAPVVMKFAGKRFDEAAYARRYYQENRSRLLAQRKLERRTAFERRLARAIEETRARYAS